MLAVQLVLGGLLLWGAATGFPFLRPLVRAAAAASPVPPVHAAARDRFDAGRAWRELLAEVAVGPRPAGSATLRRLALRLRGELPDAHLEAIPGHPGLRNVVGELPGRMPAVVLGAHYDSKDIPGIRFLGANDSAGGTAVVLELARDLAAMHRPAGAPALRFVLFDGEEAPPGVPDRDFLRGGDRGSRAYVAAHGAQTREMILVDFVGNRGLRLPREQGSDPALWSRLRRAAQRVGEGAVFPAATVPAIEDDHTPFTEAGIPAIDLIDFSYPCWHQACDLPDQLAPASLAAAGKSLLELLGSPPGA